MPRGTGTRVTTSYMCETATGMVQAALKQDKAEYVALIRRRTTKDNARNLKGWTLEFSQLSYMDPDREARFMKELNLQLWPEGMTAMLESPPAQFRRNLVVLRRA